MSIGSSLFTSEWKDKDEVVHSKNGGFMAERSLSIKYMTSVNRDIAFDEQEG